MDVPRTRTRPAGLAASSTGASELATEFLVHLVLVHLENCPEFVIAWHACAAIGAVAVTTNTRSVADEMRYFCEDSQPACAITEPQFAGMIAACAPQLKWQAIRDEDSWTALTGDPGEFSTSTARNRELAGTKWE